ncbi:hypothetical protein B0H14DRAFT_2964601 [Mycena olivaceomarginata]|nr:hypothetical protein B0H14DRAFT_2964601 [Mycena olivaceomarginata]
MADESPALSASQTGSQKRPWVISDSPTRSLDSRPTRPVLESHPPRLGSQALPINVEDTSPAGSSRGAFVTLHANPAGRATLLITDEPLRSKINIRPRPGPIGHHDGWRRSNARGVPESQLLHSGPRPPSLTAKEPHHQCTICHCVKTHPVSYKCGHTHCFICIRVWLQISWKCPDCNQVMHGPPSRNYDVEDWLSSAYPKIAADGSRVTYSWSGLVFPSAPI